MITWCVLQAARFFSQLHVYSPDTNRWSHVLPRVMPGTPSAPPGTAGHAACVVRNKMVVFGGSHGHGVRWELYVWGISWCQVRIYIFEGSHGVKWELYVWWISWCQVRIYIFEWSHGVRWELYDWGISWCQVRIYIFDGSHGVRRELCLMDLMVSSENLHLGGISWCQVRITYLRDLMVSGENYMFEGSHGHNLRWNLYVWNSVSLKCLSVDWFSKFLHNCGMWCFQL